MSYGIISADDHVMERPEIWTDRLPAWAKAEGPRTERRKITYKAGLSWDFEYADDGEWADIWHYEDFTMANFLSSSCAGVAKEDVVNVPVLYENMRPGCCNPGARLADMDVNGVDASLCFPNMFVRFCGQRFLTATDKRLAGECVRAYNDYIVEEWSSGSGERLVPLCIVPLWDVELATAELRRNAGRGVRAVTFSEQPHLLGLPSIHSGYWDPFIAACEETGTVINLHIGSGSHLASTSADAPSGVGTLLSFVTPAMAMSDWLLSGHLARHPKLVVALAECNIGWIPYVLERADTRWEEGRGYQPEWKTFDSPPSEYFARNMYCSFFNDQAGLAYISKVGVRNNFGFGNLTFETDYPHSDGTWPNSRAVADGLMKDLTEADRKKLLHDNAARMLGLTLR